MASGIDTNRDTTQAARCLAGMQFEFIGRYYSRNVAKRMTRLEAELISATGMKVVALWESGYPNRASYFGHDEGARDGVEACQYAATAIEQPPGTPIYFVVDYDATDKDVNGPIADYFRGIGDALRAAGSGTPPYRIGVYGSGAVCAALLDSSIADLAWLAQSKDWRGSEAFARWAIKQGDETTLCGIELDPNESVEEYGGFRVGGSPPIA